MPKYLLVYSPQQNICEPLIGLNTTTMASETLMEDESGVLMGIDLGTSSVKVVILDAHGTVVASNSKSTDAEVPSDVGNIGHEQNPYKILETVLDLALPMLNQHKCHIKGNSLCPLFAQCY